MKADETWATATGFDEKFVESGKVTRNFDVEANWRMIQLLVSTGRVSQIFVDRAIKAAFCAFAAERGSRREWASTLVRLQHWDGHRDHMHVRLTCPAKSTECRPETAPSGSDGCDAYLDPRGKARFMNFELAPPEETRDPNQVGC
jgi:murein endopeptidase